MQGVWRGIVKDWGGHGMSHEWRVALRSLQMLASCCSLHLVPEWHGIATSLSPSFCFTLFTYLLSLPQAALCWPLRLQLLCFSPHSVWHSAFRHFKISGLTKCSTKHWVTPAQYSWWGLILASCIADELYIILPSPFNCSLLIHTGIRDITEWKVVNFTSQSVR